MAGLSEGGEPGHGHPKRVERRDAFVQGLLGILSTPIIVLTLTFTGFGALSREAGFSLSQSVFMTMSVFALPGQVVLADQVLQGGTVLATGFAVMLTAVRLLPLTASLMPYLQDGRTPRWLYYFLAHFVAVTVWVESMRRLPEMPVDLRVPYYSGLVLVLAATTVAGTATGYYLAGGVPVTMKASLLFLTPIYFLLSLLLVGMTRTDGAAIMIGAFLGPIFFMLFPGFDLLLTGLVGGTLAYGGGRWILPGR